MSGQQGGGGDVPSPELLSNIETALLNTTFEIYIHSNVEFEYPRDPRVHFHLRDFDLNIKGIPFKEDNPKYDGKNGKRIAHIADIYRLEILYEYGGIYSDFDVLWLRNPWEYLDHKLVIGYTNKAYKILCNAVLMSEKGHPALLEYKKWLIDIYPCSKYWTPANPYKLWASREDVTFVDRHLFYPIKWNETTNLTLDKIQKSIAVHEFASNNTVRSGEVYEKLNALRDKL
jgi:hypothetical protein